MTLVENQTRLAVIAGTIVLSGSATNVVGGVMTAGTFDADASAALTFDAFKAAPRVFLSPNTNVDLGYQLTGLGVSNVSVRLIMSAATASGGDFNVMLIGLQNL